MTKQATHNGTCQVCGREQALPEGVLAKHGYTVEHHFFEGVCPGAACLPLELNRNVADRVAGSLMQQAAEGMAKAERIIAGTLRPKFAPAGFDCKGRDGRWTSVEVLFADADEYNQKQAIASFLYQVKSKAQAEKQYAEAMIARADKITGKQELTPRVEESKKEIVPGMRVHLHGKTGYDVTVIAIENRKAWGVGPHLNGRVLPHIVFERNGKQYGYPVRNIRQAAIVG